MRQVDDPETGYSGRTEPGCGREADLAARVVLEGRFDRIETVAGLDVAYDRQGK
jgi:hypothetical protein